MRWLTKLLEALSRAFGNRRPRVRQPGLASAHIRPTPANDDVWTPAEGSVYFQPVVELRSNRVVGQETIYRNSNAAQYPLYRHRAVDHVAQLQERGPLFLGTHPAELQGVAHLLDSVVDLHTKAPEVDLVLGVHESAVTKTEDLVWLRAKLLEINVALAYDNFGHGQARIFELAEALPHYLKFARTFISGSHHQDPTMRRTLVSLVAMCDELLVVCVATGIETADEARACVDVGFKYGRGNYFGAPEERIRSLPEPS